MLKSPKLPGRPILKTTLGTRGWKVRDHGLVEKFEPGDFLGILTIWFQAIWRLALVVSV